MWSGMDSVSSEVLSSRPVFSSVRAEMSSWEKYVFNGHQYCSLPCCVEKGKVWGLIKEKGTMKPQRHQRNALLFRASWLFCWITEVNQ